MLNTEQRNPRTTHIDKMPTAEMLAVMQEEYVNAAKAVELELPAIEAAVEAITARMSRGGRLFYMGCGTSGRLGVLDAAECPPTYGVDHGLVIGIIAGGDGAIRRAVENAEDSYEAGHRDLSVHEPNENDTLIGISVAGVSPIAVLFALGVSLLILFFSMLVPFIKISRVEFDTLLRGRE